MSSELKRCVKCTETLPIERFSKNKNTKDGLQKYCKKCKFIADKLSRMAKIISIPNDAQFPHTYSKRCNMCNKDKSLDAFYKSSEDKDGRQKYCKECAKQYERDRYEFNKLVKQNNKLVKQNRKQTQSNFNNIEYFEKLRGEDGSNAGRPNDEFYELTPSRIEFLNQQREYWREVFAERHDDVMKLIEAYEAEPSDSVSLITSFHDNTRINWKLKHKTIKEQKNEYFEFLRNKHTLSGNTGDDSRNEVN